MNHCPKCKIGILGITAHHDLGPDTYNDDFVFKVFTCSKCSLVGAGYYQESRRGSGESWRHCGYEVALADYRRLLTDLERCPQNGYGGCECAVFTKYNRLRHADGSHDPLQGIRLIGDLIHLG